MYREDCSGCEELRIQVSELKTQLENKNVSSQELFPFGDKCPKCMGRIIHKYVCTGRLKYLFFGEKICPTLPHLHCHCKWGCSSSWLSKCADDSNADRQ